MYKEEEYLQLSGLHHFAFCRRRWSLVHIEQQWAENYRTVDGELMHKNAHDSNFIESRGDRLITRGVYVFSARLGVSGQCDVLEFYRSPDGITLAGREGRWQPFPVEYKRGKEDIRDADRMQLCGQALCLEEMLCCQVSEGALYFGETRRRERVTFTPVLREQVEKSLCEMHDLYRRHYTPKAKPVKGCTACSLRELCLPRLAKGGSVDDYLRRSLEGEDDA